MDAQETLDRTLSGIRAMARTLDDGVKCHDERAALIETLFHTQSLLDDGLPRLLDREMVVSLLDRVSTCLRTGDTAGAQWALAATDVAVTAIQNAS